MVVRGSVRVMTAVVTKKQSFSAEELRPSDYQRWRDLRAHLQQCEETRRRQFRFRKDPAAYLAVLERRSRNGKDEIDRPSERWLAQEKRPWEAEKRRCNHPFGNHQSSYQNKKSRL